MPGEEPSSKRSWATPTSILLDGDETIAQGLVRTRSHHMLRAEVLTTKCFNDR
ncbi:MAG: hypothetical protein ACRC62_34495 [Microcoleus sp.]